MDLFQIPQMIITMIALIAVIITFCVLIREFHCEKQYTVIQPPKSILIPTYCAIIFLFVSMLSSVINIGINPPFLLDLVNDTVTIMTWVIGHLFVFIIIMTRLHYISSSTNYQLIEHNYIIFGILIFVGVLLCIVWILRSILYYTQYKTGNISQKGLQEFGFFFVITVAIIDLIISTFFVGIFINKLIHIAKDSKINKSLNQEEVRSAITKHWILSVIIIVSTQIIAFILCMVFLTAYIGYNISNQIFTIMYDMSLPLNPIIICVCLFLMFQTYQEHYDKTCMICDNTAMNCFDNISETKPKKKYKLKDNTLRQSLLEIEETSYNNRNKK
eukprot:98624_1